jgi:trans-aconitate methyltransferase
MKAVYEETSEDQDAIIRRGDWRYSCPHMQGLVFMQAALAQLPPEFLRTRWKKDIHDWGCGFGGGTALLQAAWPEAHVVGLDYSPAVIAMARDRWPAVDFVKRDIHNTIPQVEIITTSHCIEHLSDPAETINRLYEASEHLLVIVPPITDEADGGHHDAIRTEDWLPKIPVPTLMKKYITRRKTRDPQYPTIDEGNILLFWTGKPS